jgi:hypothetical protein
MNRLHEKGLMTDSVNKTKSIVLIDEGSQKAGQLFMTPFARP